MEPNRTKLHLSVKLAIVAAGLWLVSLQPALSQPAREYEPFVRTPEYNAAMEQISGRRGTREEGIAELLRIARANPGTTLGAHSYFSAACYCEDRALMVQIYQEVIRVFPNSGFDLSANSALIALQSKDQPEYERATWALIGRFGGPTLAEIGQSPSGAVGRLQALPKNIQAGLREPYRLLAHNLGSPKVARYSDALLLGTFGLAAYLDQNSRNTFGNAVYSADYHFREQFPAFATRILNLPRIKVRSPKQDCGQRPIVRFQVLLRDGRSSHLIPSTWRFYLDGTEVSSEVRLLNWRFNPWAKPHQYVQQYLVEYRPPQSLGAGRHTLSGILTRRTNLPDPRALHFEIPFRVKPGEKDDHDSKDRDHWDEDD